MLLQQTLVIAQVNRTKVTVFAYSSVQPVLDSLSVMVSGFRVLRQANQSHSQQFVPTGYSIVCLKLFSCQKAYTHAATQ